MRYEFLIEMRCKKCGALHRITEGVQGTNSQTNTVLNKSRNHKCEACGNEMEPISIKKTVIDKNTIKDESEIWR